MPLHSINLKLHSFFSENTSVIKTLYYVMSSFIGGPDSKYYSGLKVLPRG